MTEKKTAPTILSWIITPSEEKAQLAPGTEIEGFRIIDVIGKGGMGTVYRALHILLNREVALKVLAPQFAIREDLVNRFLREARALADLPHPGIIAVHDVKLAGLHPFIVMEYVRGASLSALLKERKRLTLEEAVRITRCIAEALEAAHSHGIIHRDLKPANILLSPDGAVKVADFGLACLVGEPETERSTRADTIMGTPGYMSPEQSVSARNVDARSDLYSLGAIFYEMLTGQLPSGHFQPPEKLNAAVTPELSALILRMLSHDPTGRPAGARVIADALAPENGASSNGNGMLLPEPSIEFPPVEAVWADRSFATALAGLLLVCLASFKVLDTGKAGLAMQALVPLCALAALGTGWWSLQQIRRSRGRLRGARFATFGILVGLWLFFILEASRRFNAAPAVVFLARFPLVIAAVSCFTLWDWLVRPNDDLGTLFTERGGHKERFAWLALLLLPAFLLIPFIRIIEPEYLFRGFLFRWIALGVGPTLYLLLVILPGLKLVERKPKPGPLEAV